MNMQIRNLAGSLVLLGCLGLAGRAAGRQVYAGQAVPPDVSTLRLSVDKPIIHLGERVWVSGSHFTPGASVAIKLHGPESATLGRVYAVAQVNGLGDFSVGIGIPSYPDAAARQWHTVVVAALSSAMVRGVQEGAAVAVQADPMPGIDIVSKAGPVRASLVIDGSAVQPLVMDRGTAHYWVGYAGHLRAGIHSAYLKWADAAGGGGACAWSFHIGSPYAVDVAPRLRLSAYRIRLGEELGVEGSGFTPGATVAISAGGPNTQPGTPLSRVIADGNGAFHLLIRITPYPSHPVHREGEIYVGARASGPMVGDLPEGVAVLVQVTG